MNAVLVWVLVSVGGYNSNQVYYSPPMQDLATCEFLQKNLPRRSAYDVYSRCVQIKMVVSK